MIAQMFCVTKQLCENWNTPNSQRMIYYQVTTRRVEENADWFLLEYYECYLCNPEKGGLRITE